MVIISGSAPSVSYERVLMNVADGLEVKSKWSNHCLKSGQLVGEMTMGNREHEIIYSPLCRKFAQDDKTIDIYI